MKPVTIRKHLHKIVKDWLMSLPESIRTENIIVTGGAIGSLLTGQKVNDYDLYFTNKDDATRIARHYTSLLPCNTAIDVVRRPVETLYGEEDDVLQIVIASSGQWVREDECDDPYHVKFVSQNAITLSDDIQLVTRFVGTPEYIHRHFDFRHATNYYCFKTNRMHLNVEAMADLMNHTLFYQGSLYPLASLFRLRKFLARGWRVTAGEILKIAHQCSKINWSNTEVLREQLTGVDLAYMHGLIAALTSISPEKLADCGYVAEIIDRIFEGADDETEQKTQSTETPAPSRPL
jgi:hypothetical protein